MNLLAKPLLTTLLLLSALFSSNVFAVDEIYTALFSNKAIRGYDTVAYFTQGEAVEGKDEFTTQYKGADWLFASQENLDLFLGDPEKYAPQYGGYCAYAVSLGKTASIQPDQFTILEGRLYLNYNKKINQKWLDNKEQYIQEADQNWPSVLSE